MQGSENSNVVSIFEARKKALKARKKKEEPEREDDVAFDDIMQRNLKNLERMRKDRRTANKSVLRSYRIKH